MMMAVLRCLLMILIIDIGHWKGWLRGLQAYYMSLVMNVYIIFLLFTVAVEVLPGRPRVFVGYLFLLESIHLLCDALAFRYHPDFEMGMFDPDELRLNLSTRLFWISEACKLQLSIFYSRLMRIHRRMQSENMCWAVMCFGLSGIYHHHFMAMCGWISPVIWIDLFAIAVIYFGFGYLFYVKEKDFLLRLWRKLSSLFNYALV